jgi:hypothetical protein
MHSLGAEPGNGTPQRNQLSVHRSASTTFFGIGSLIVAGIGVPMLLTMASKDRLTTADQWVIRGAALATAAIVAPLGYMYLAGLQKNGR